MTQVVRFEEAMEGYWDRDDYERTVGEYWASECWQCPAKVLFNVRNDIVPEQELPYGIFERGNMAEDFVEDVLYSHYGEEYVLREVPILVKIGDEIQVTGRADAVIIGRNLEVLKVIEIKSKGGSPYRSSTHHKYQLHHYTKALNPKHGSSLVYVNANDYDDYKEFNVPFDEEKWNSVVRYWISVHEQFGSEPLAQPKAKWECFWTRNRDKTLSKCDYYDACGEHTKDGPKHEVPEKMMMKVLEGSWRLG